MHRSSATNILNHTILLTIVLLLTDVRGGYIQLNGAGASFPEAVYSSWIPLYKASRLPTQLNLTYESVGSGKGKTKIKEYGENAIHYAGSDSLLSEEEYKNNPDLQMFPTMAGAVVLSFNLPGIKRLNVTTDQIVGIYDGTLTRWNDPSLQAMNPDVDMPDKQIIPIARAEKSGTTEIFTTALSAFNKNWRTHPGIFSLGLDENDIPYYWNSSVVKTFGVSTRGMTGMILSLKYSIGYLSVADARSVDISEVMIRNSAGTLVAATSETVESTMKDRANLMTSRLTTDLVNSPSLLSYPIVGYTYFIIHMSNMSNCESARELARYILWFLKDETAVRECANKDMFPLPEVLVTIIEERVIKQMSCKESNVYELLMQQIQSEKKITLNLAPVYIGTSVCCVAIVVVIVIVRERIIRNKAILRSEWKIPTSLFNQQKELTKLAQKNFSNKNKIGPSVTSLKSDRSLLSSISTHCVKWKGAYVTTGTYRLDKTLLSIRKKELVLSLRDVIHENIVRFYGLCSSEDKYVSVVDYCDRGCIYSILHDTRYKMSTEFKYSICHEICNGLQYLHDRNIIHGHLMGSSCYFYHNWNVRIGGWERHAIEKKKDKKFRLLQPSTEWLSLESTEHVRTKYWTAPEVFLSGGQFMKASDIYSFAIVVQEIFSRKLPYEELYDSHSPHDIVKNAVNFELRPEFTTDTPDAARDIMNMSWEYDPSARPDVSMLQNFITSASRSERSVMDCVFQTMETYVKSLEKTQMKLLEKFIPRHLVKSVSEKDATKMDVHPSASILVYQIDNFNNIPIYTDASELVCVLNNIHNAVDNVLATLSRVTRVDTLYRYDTFAAGLLHPPTSVTLSQQSTNYTYDLVSFLFQMKTKLSQLAIPHSSKVAINFGISSGSVSTGFMKGPVPKYYAFGEPVYEATALCQQANTDSTLITESTATLLKDYPGIAVNEICIFSGKKIYQVCYENDDETATDDKPAPSEQMTEGDSTVAVIDMEVPSTAFQNPDSVV